MQRRHRLSRSRDFDTVYRQGTSVSTRYLTLHWFPRDEDAEGEPRLGLAVPRSVGSAVVRNRVKRLLREAWSKLLESAVANAAENHSIDDEDLRIVFVTADEGPTLERFRPRAMGRATKIRKRTSHLSIGLEPKE